MKLFWYSRWKACVRGRRESIQEANTIFNRLEELGAAFPIGIDDQGGSDHHPAGISSSS